MGSKVGHPDIDIIVSGGFFDGAVEKRVFGIKLF
jgi:hypothetical protein